MAYGEQTFITLGKTESILFGPNKNISKVESFEVKCGNETIKYVKHVKYLGLQIENDLSGKSIVNKIIKKANSKLKCVYRCREMLNFESRNTLCSALIQCLFDYSCSYWYTGIGKGLLDKLQVMQNKIIRFILN